MQRENYLGDGSGAGHGCYCHIDFRGNDGNAGFIRAAAQSKVRLMLVHGMYTHIDFWHAGNRNANIRIGHFNRQGPRVFTRVKTGRERDEQA